MGWLKRRKLKRQADLEWIGSLVRRADAADAALKIVTNHLSERTALVERGKRFHVSELTFDVYEALLMSNQRYTDIKTADDGYENLLFKNHPVIRGMMP